jgi:hypothetical protein
MLFQSVNPNKQTRGGEEKTQQLSLGHHLSITCCFFKEGLLTEMMNKFKVKGSCTNLGTLRALVNLIDHEKDSV